MQNVSQLISHVEQDALNVETYGFDSAHITGTNISSSTGLEEGKYNCCPEFSS
jgi:hypothetical protein